MQKVSLRVPGSCGELIQGTLKGNNFLISCPINLYSKVTAFKIKSAAGNKIEITKKYSNFYAENQLKDSAIDKAKKAVQKIIDHYEFKNLKLKIEIDSELIPGIGMASSTADITGAAAAVMLLLNQKVDFELLKKTSLNIEPSDSVFLPGLRIFDHLEGKIDRFLAEAPEVDILIFKEKGRVDSLTFNNSKKLSALNSAKEGEIKKSLKLIKKALNERDYSLLGKSCSLSSLAHQQILAKKNLSKLLKITANWDQVYGVNIAHSGTITGVLIKEGFKAEKLREKIRNQTELEFLKRVKMISGGIERRDEFGRSAWRKIN